MAERSAVPRQLLTAAEAADWLGCSERHFESVLRPHIPEVDLARPGAGRPMPRFDVDDLAAFVARRKRTTTEAA